MTARGPETERSGDTLRRESPGGQVAARPPGVRSRRSSALRRASRGAIALSALLLGCALQGSAQQAGWPAPRGVLAAGRAAVTGPVEPEVVWTAALERTPAPAPVADTERVYVVDGRQLRAHALSDGREAWSVDCGSTVTGISLGGEGLYVATHDGDLLVLSSDNGARAWSVRADVTSRPGVATWPVAGESGAVFVGGRASLQAVARGTDRPLWTWSCPASDDDLTFLGPLTVTAQGAVLVPCSTGALVSLDAASGQVVWEYTAARYAVPFPAAVDRATNRVYWVSASSTPYRSDAVCLDAASGEVVWRAPLPSWVCSGLALSSGGVLAVTADGVLRCMSLDDGRALWDARLPPGSVPAVLEAAPVTDAAGRVYLAVSTALLCYSGEGRLVSSLSLPGYFTISHLALPKESMLVIVLAPNVYALSERE